MRLKIPPSLGPVLALLALWTVCGLAVAVKAVYSDGLPEGPGGLGRLWQAVSALGTGSYDEFCTPWTFFSGRNQGLMLVQSAIVAVAACGMTAIIVSGGIDLSVGSSIALSGVVAALVLHSGGDPLLAVAAAMLAGCALGALNGGLIAGLGLMSFIATLGTLGVARGLAKWLADNQTVNFEASWLDRLMQPFPAAGDPWWLRVLPVAPGVLVAVLVAVAMAVVMARSVPGRHVYAIGSNAAAARLCGIRVGWTLLGVYAVAGALFGLAGAMETAKLHQGDPTTAMGRELDVIAAVVIGGASLSGGTGTVWGAVVGALIMAVLRNGTQQLDWPTYVQEILIGAVIVGAVALDRWRNRRASAA
jgi:ribose transport system permease protein